MQAIFDPPGGWSVAPVALESAAEASVRDLER